MLYSRGKRPRYPLDRRLGAPQSQYERGGEQKKSDHCPHRELNPDRLTGSLVHYTDCGIAAPKATNKRRATLQLFINY